ncbi:hypothetical protein CDAR_564191, partial [Caerostris darwini]
MRQHSQKPGRTCSVPHREWMAPASPGLKSG